MASGITGAAAAGGAFVATPYVGWIVGIAAAYIDATVVMPRIAGRGREQSRGPRLLDVPVGSNDAGAPRIWALGSRCRVPTHVLWQSRKIRETNAGSNKAGTAVPQRKVNIDALVALNDRATTKLRQLRGNGALLLFKDRNLVVLTSSEMSVAFDAGVPAATVTMNSVADPSPTQYFEVGDIIKPSDWVNTAGPTNFNNTYWEVTSISDHAGTTPGFVVLAPRDGQTLTSMAYNAGSVFSPASLARVDDAIVLDPSSATTVAYGGAGSQLLLRNTIASGKRFRQFVFEIGDLVRVRSLQSSPGAISFPRDEVFRVTGLVFTNFSIYSSEIQLTPQNTVTNGAPAAGLTYVSVSATDPMKIEFANPKPFTAGIFPDDFDPDAQFYRGVETQGENSLLVADKGTGNVTAYRGVAYQGLDQFYATRFGDQLPFSMEALIDIDQSMTWPQAVRAVLERAGIPFGAIDVDGIPGKPFAGMFLRGAVPTITAMQPMLVAGSLLGQERDGTIAMFTLETADTATVANEATLTDFGTRSQLSQREDDKWRIEDTAEEDLPTSIGIRHQDPDNAYADGYQHFGLRSPGGVDHQNEQELDLSNIVLTRKEARNLATTTMRRAWINRRRYSFTLPAAYLDVLENDLIDWVDDDGDTIRVRVIQRDIGSDFRVSVVGIAEELNAQVSNAGTDGPPEYRSGISPPVALDVVVIDAPAIVNSETINPAVQLAVCSTSGTNFQGAQVWESVDGASYKLAGSIGNQSAIGTLDDALAEGDPAEVYGSGTVTLTAQTVDVTFSYAGDTAIEEATQAEAEAGKNWVAIIQSDGEVEIAAFTTVTPNGGDNYTLGGWLRGLRGTTSLERAAGSRIVLLDGYVFRREFAGTITPKTLEYKVVPVGASIDEVDEIAVTATWRNASPLPVRSVSKVIGGSPYDATFTVDAHWCRAVQPLGAQPLHPMDEAWEEYRLDIYDPTGVTLVRQKTLTAANSGSPTLSSRDFVYTAAEQTTDGYTPAADEEFNIDVVQVGQFGESPSIKQTL